MTPPPVAAAAASRMRNGQYVTKSKKPMSTPKSSLAWSSRF